MDVFPRRRRTAVRDSAARLACRMVVAAFREVGLVPSDHCGTHAGGESRSVGHQCSSADGGRCREQEDRGCV